MTRILNEKGEYAPTQATSEAPTRVRASSLPQNEGDPYANVDHRAFHQMPHLNRDQLVQMGTVAEYRGDMQASMRWKAAAAERQALDESQAAKANMFDGFTPKAVPQAGSRIMDVPDNTPWGQDDEYRRLTINYQEAKQAVESAPRSEPDLMKLREAQARAHDAMIGRENQVKAGMRESGAWTEMNERQLEAQRSVKAKSKSVADTFVTEAGD